MKRIFNFNGFFNNSFSYVSELFIYDWKFNTSGIYIIKNKITNECYVGQSINMKRRLREHKQLLRQNKCKYRNGELTILQKAWNKYGENNFTFEYLEQCDKNNLDEREKYWIQKLQCNKTITGKGYNLCEGGTGSGNVKNKRVNKIKGSIIVNNGSVQKYINPNELLYYESIGFQRGLLTKNKEKMKNAKRIIRKGKDHPNYNKTWSKEARMKFNNTIKNRTIKPSDKRKPVVQETLNGVFVERFISITEASVKNNIPQSSIVNCCKGKSKTAGGFKWRYDN